MPTPIYRLVLTLAVLVGLSLPALAQTQHLDRLTVGGGGRPDSSTSVRLNGLATSGTSAGVLLRESDGDLFTRALTASDIPSSFVQRNVGETISSAWTFSGGINGPLSIGTSVASPIGTFSTRVTTPEFTSGSGVIVFGSSTTAVRPTTNYGPDLGGASNKYRTIWGGELFLETIVAQNRITTMGGRFTVTPSNVLTRDIASGTGGNIAMCVKYNSFLHFVGGVEWGSKLLMEKNGQFEWFYVTSTTTPTVDPTFGDYCYNVDRNMDGSGQNAWTAGDGIVDTGKIGSGMIDQFAVRGLQSATIAGPAIDFLVRTADGYTGLSHRASVGNLNGRFGYSTNTYGIAAGNYSATWIAADATNGFRVGFGASLKFHADASGNVSLSGDVLATNWTLTNANGLTVERSLTGSISTGRAIRIGTSGTGYGDLRVWSDSSGNGYIDSDTALFFGDGAGYAGRNTSVLIRSDGTSTTVGSLHDAGIRVTGNGIIFEFTKQGGSSALVDYVRPNTNGMMSLGHPSFRWLSAHFALPAETDPTYAVVGNATVDNTRLAYFAGFTGTITVRNSAGTGTCTITYKAGLVASTTC